MVEVQKFQNAGATMPPELKATVFLRTGKVIGDCYTPKELGGWEESKKEDEGITINHLHRLNQKNLSAWNMKILMNIVRKGALSTLDEQLQHSTGEDETARQITNEFQAKAAAKKVFYNVAKPGSKYNYQEDLMQFMRGDEALKTILLFEGAHNIAAQTISLIDERCAMQSEIL